MTREEASKLLKEAQEAIVKAIEGGRVIKAAQKYIDQLILDVDMGCVVWTDARVSDALKKDAARGFEGKSKKFTILVVEANIVDVGIDYSGMFVINGPADVNIVHMPKELARWVYKKTSAGRN